LNITTTEIESGGESGGGYSILDIALAVRSDSFSVALMADWDVNCL